MLLLGKLGPVWGFCFFIFPLVGLTLLIMLSPFSHLSLFVMFFFCVLTSVLLPCFLRNLYDSWIFLDLAFFKCSYIHTFHYHFTTFHLLSISFLFLLPTTPGFLVYIKQGFGYGSLERELNSWCPVIMPWKGSCALAKVKMLFTVASVHMECFT